MANLLIFVPAYGHMVSSATFESIVHLLPALMSKGIGGGVSVLSYPEISESRNIALTGFYDTPQCQDATHILFVDADMGFSPQVVLDMLLVDKPMVGAIYRQKNPNVVSWAASGLPGPNAVKMGDFMKVAGLGMGCFLIRRDVVTTMIEKMPELVDTRIALHPAKDMLQAKGRIFRFFDPIDNPNSGRMSEDLAFCYRWREVCGGEIWAAVNHDIHHFGQYDYVGNYVRHIEEKHQSENAAALSIAAE